MAISVMQHLSLILPKELLDTLLFYLQDLQIVQLNDLHQEKDWQSAFERSLVGRSDETLTLQELKKRQELIERLIVDLEAFLPKKKLFEKLSEKPMELFLSDIEKRGAECDEESLVQSIRHQLQTLSQLQDQLETNQLEYEALEKWENLDITPSTLQQFRHIRGLVGVIPNQADDSWRVVLENYPDLDYQEIFVRDTECGLVLLYRGGQYERIHPFLQDLQFKQFYYEYLELPRERLAMLQHDMNEQIERIATLKASLVASKSQLDQLKIQLDYICNLYSRQEMKSQLASTKYLVALEGWIERDQVSVLEACLKEQFGQSILILTREIRSDEEYRVPTKLKNNALVEPFELVTAMYSLPKYGDKDPTPLVSLFYFVFFGMMVADIGYGLLLFVATSLALRFFYVKQDLAKSLRFFRLLGVAVMIWGLVYGSFLGFELPFALISTSTDIMTILVISVIFGFMTILAGLWLSGTKNLRLKDYGGAYNSGFAWILILLGLLFIVLGKLFPALAILAPIGQWLAILNALGILVVSVVTSKKITGLIAGLFNLYNISSYVGDLVSFTRLMALGLAGASMGSAFNLIVSLFPPIGRYTVGIVAFVLLHLVNMSLAFLSGYVHSARLIFVEFFGKFYDGGGKAFTPLKSAEKYVKHKK